MSVYYLSAKFSVLSACLVFNESFKSRTAAGGGYIHFLYFTCAMAREKESRGLGGGGARGGCGGCRVVVMNVLQLKRILCHFPGEREIKVVAGEREMWEEMLGNRMCCVDGAEFFAARRTLLPF